MPDMLLTVDSQFTCPRPGCGASFPVALVRGGPLTGRCPRCERPYLFTPGSPSTTTSGVANTPGAVVLTVVAGGAFNSGSWIVIGSVGVNGGAEIVKASAAGGATTIPITSTPLRLSHAAGATVQTATVKWLSPLSGNLAGG